MNSENGTRPLTRVTGASRRNGIGAAPPLALLPHALDLTRGGWDGATTFWRGYDETSPMASRWLTSV
jgi:hypothetical protein